MDKNFLQPVGDDKKSVNFLHFISHRRVRRTHTDFLLVFTLMAVTASLLFPSPS
jgi:hypothetical protein